MNIPKQLPDAPAPARPHTGTYTRQRPAPVSIPPPPPILFKPRTQKPRRVPPGPKTKKKALLAPLGGGGKEPSSKVLPHTPELRVGVGAPGTAWCEDCFPAGALRITGAGWVVMPAGLQVRGHVEKGVDFRSEAQARNEKEQQPHPKQKPGLAERARAGMRGVREGMRRMARALKGELFGTRGELELR
eukprot:RCo037850